VALRQLTDQMLRIDDSLSDALSRRHRNQVCLAIPIGLSKFLFRLHDGFRILGPLSDTVKSQVGAENKASVGLSPQRGIRKLDEQYNVPVEYVKRTCPTISTSHFLT